MSWPVCLSGVNRGTKNKPESSTPSIPPYKCSANLNFEIINQKATSGCVIHCSNMSLLQNMLLNPYGSIFHQFDDSGDDGIRMDWKETEAAHVLKADLPGFKKEDVKVEVEDCGVISITAKRPRDEKDHEEEECTWHCSERSRDGFLRWRRFRLPEDAKAEEAKASMENGVLTLVLPKMEAKKPQVRLIEIEGGDGKKKKRSEKGKKNKDEAVRCGFWHR